jgi:hypothetical protein
MVGALAAAGESGPVVILSGETDLTTVARVSALISGQLPAGVLTRGTPSATSPRRGAGV